MIIVRPADLFVPDNALYLRSVQEPHEQYDNVTLFISTDGAKNPSSVAGIRLRGLFWSDTTGQWEVRQSLESDGSGGWDLLDAAVDSGMELISPNDPIGGPTGIYPFAPDFRPAAENDNFATAVLALDNGSPRRERVFAAHAGIDPVRAYPKTLQPYL